MNYSKRNWIFNHVNLTKRIRLGNIISTEALLSLQKLQQSQWIIADIVLINFVPVLDLKINNIFIFNESHRELNSLSKVVGCELRL